MSEEVVVDGQDTSAEVEVQDTREMSREQLRELASGGHETVSDDVSEESEGEEENTQESSEEGAEDSSPPEGDDQKEEEPKDNDYEATIASLQERIEQQSKLLDKFGTEVGLLRKQSPEDEKAKLEAIRDLYLDDPVEGHKAMMAHFREQEKIEKQGREEEFKNIIAENRNIITSSIKDFEKNLDGNVSEIAELMKEDGADSTTINAFKENPYVIDGSVLFALHKRNEVVRENKALKDQLAEKEKEVETLKKKPGQVLDSIEKATSIKPLSGRSGSTSAMGKNNNPVKVTQLSREDLKRIANGG